MSYVRWISKVRQNCTACGDRGLIPDVDTLTGQRLCCDCTSCWYIYWSVGDYISVNHSGCSGDLEQTSTDLDFEDALAWHPPADCPMADVALRAVKAAHDDWIARGKPKS